MASSYPMHEDLMLNVTQPTINYGDPTVLFSQFLLMRIGQYLIKYAKPVLCVTGILGNFVSMLVFLSKTLRRKSSNIYLAALSVASVIFCTSTFVFWLDDVNVKVASKPVLCQTFVFLSYYSSFLTVWFVVCITFENFMITTHTHRAVKICTVAKAKWTVTVISLIAMALYSFALWTTESDGNSCMTGYKYRGIVANLTYVDTTLTLIIPALAMLFFIGSTLKKYLIHRRPSVRDRPRRDRSRRRLFEGSLRRKSLLRVTRLLLAISLSHVLLAAPMYINQIRVIIGSTFDGELLPILQEIAIQQICFMTYYMTFTLNTMIYLKWSFNYQKTLKTLFLKIWKPNNINGTDVVLIPLCALGRRSTV